jgi:hypothetical protein
MLPGRCQSHHHHEQSEVRPPVAKKMLPACMWVLTVSSLPQDGRPSFFFRFFLMKSHFDITGDYKPRTA